MTDFQIVAGSDAAVRPCETCGANFVPSKKKRKRPPQRFCSNTQRGRGEGKAYRKLNGRHEHRVVAEKKVGRPLKFQDVVHHKDGNIHNNHPDNLEVITRRQHMFEHDIWSKRRK